MKTQESNKIISEFMGMPIPRQSPWTTLPTFNNSWDYLMPVIEKIEALEGIERVDIFYKNCQITYSDEDNEYLRGGKDCRGVKGDTKLLACYQAAVEFIQWYNGITPNIYYED